MKKVIMRSTYVILKDLKLVIDIFEGILTLENFKEHKLKQINEMDFDPNFNLISDFTNIEVRMSLEDVKEYTEFVKKHSKPMVGRRKAAVVVNNPNQFIYAKQYDSNIKEETGQQLYTFTGFDEAIAWLALTEHKKVIMDTITHYRKNPLFTWEADKTISF